MNAALALHEGLKQVTLFISYERNSIFLAFNLQENFYYYGITPKYNIFYCASLCATLPQLTQLTKKVHLEICIKP